MNLLIQQKETHLSIEDFFKPCGIFWLFDLSGELITMIVSYGNQGLVPLAMYTEWTAATKITGTEKIDLFIIPSDFNESVILYINWEEKTSNSI